MKLQYLLLFAILFLAATCGKSDDDGSEEPTTEELPDATAQGKNTFGCLINEEVWVPYVPFDQQLVDGKQEVDNQYDDNEGFLLIARKRIEEENLSQSFILHFAVKPDTAFFKKISEFIDFKSGCNAYEIDTISSQYLNITRFDTEEKILSGQFSFTAISPDCSDTLKFTEGRFDTRYHY